MALGAIDEDNTPFIGLFQDIDEVWPIIWAISRAEGFNNHPPNGWAQKVLE